MSRRTVLVMLLAAALLGGGTATGGYLLGQGLITARQSDRSVVVKGLAQKDVRADLAVWSLRFTATGDALPDVQARIEKDRQVVRDFLAKAGFAPDEIVADRLEVTDLLAQTWRNKNTDKARYIVARTVRLRSVKIPLVSHTASRIGDLVEQGVVVTDGGGPSYYFTELNRIKPAMIAEATRNARAAAARFAQDSGSRVGGIRYASQGLFQILPRDRGTGPESSAIEKTVRVVTTVNYALEL